MSNWFDDDPFENLVEEIFGRNNPNSRRKEHFTQGEEDERVIDVLEDESRAYLIFELSGYEKEDVSITVRGKTIEILIHKKNVEGIKDYLAQKLAVGMKYSRNLPEQINPRKFDYTLKNGILEIKFNKK